MLNLVKQDSFSEVDFDQTNINVHQHESSRAKSIIVFVHGLGGRGYGTWNDFPKYVFENTDGPPRDVAIYRYSDGLRTALTLRPKLEAYFKQLSNEIEDLSEHYDDIYFAAHSLGGLMCLQAIRHHFQSAPRAPGNLQSVAGVFLFGSPQAGSQWAIKIASIVIHELKWLAPYSKAQEDVSEYLANQVHGIIDTLPSGDRNVIPRLACIGLRDKFVSSFSAAVGIPSAQIGFLDCTHKNLVKPESNESPQVAWILNQIGKISVMRQERRLTATNVVHRDRQPTGRAQYDPNILITQVWIDTDSRNWEDAYHEACNAASTENVKVVDVLDVPIGTDAELHMSLHHSRNILDNKLVDMMKIDRTLDIKANSIIILSVGAGHRESIDKINGRLDAKRAALHQGRIYIEGLTDPTTLRQFLAELISRAVNQRSRKIVSPIA